LNFININFKIYIDIKKKTLTFFVGITHVDTINNKSILTIIILRKKKKLLKLLSFFKKKLTYLMFLIKKLRPISKYKNKGIKYSYEIVIFKEGKVKQR